MVAVLAGVGLALWLYGSRHRHSLTDKDSIVLADFANTTGDTVFDGTLRQGLTVQLTQSPFLNLVSDQRIQRTLLLMGQAPGARLTIRPRSPALPANRGHSRCGGLDCQPGQRVRS